MILAAGWLTACSPASKSNLEQFLAGEANVVAASDGNLVVVAQSFANQILTEEQPEVTAAIATLPPETQALAQAAYAALQRGIEEAISQGVGALSPDELTLAQAAINAIGAASETLHSALHDPEATSGGDATLEPSDPNTLTLPATPTVVADPPASAP